MAIMNPVLQRFNLREHLRTNYPDKADLVDVDAIFDSSLSYPENLSRIEAEIVKDAFKIPDEAVSEIENNELKELNFELREKIEKLKKEKHKVTRYIPIDKFIEKIEKADIKDLAGSEPALKDFYDTLSIFPRVIIIAGKKGEGKTALAVKFLEKITRPKYSIGITIPIAKRVEEPEEIPNGSVVFINEAGINFSYFTTWSEKTQYLIDMLEILRHKDIIVITDIKNMAILNINIIRNCDTLILKRPSLMQSLFDRPQLRIYISTAREIFKKLKDTKPYALVMDDYTDFVGLIKEGLPSCWSEAISKGYKDW